MKEIEINSFAALHQVIETYDARTVIDRGMKSVKFPLMPNVGRIVPPKSSPLREANGKERAVRFLNLIPNRLRPDLRQMLGKYGVDRFAPFPGPAGLAVQIEWLQSSHG